MRVCICVSQSDYLSYDLYKQCSNTREWEERDREREYVHEPLSAVRVWMYDVNVEEKKRMNASHKEIRDDYLQSAMNCHNATRVVYIEHGFMCHSIYSIDGHRPLSGLHYPRLMHQASNSSRQATNQRKSRATKNAPSGRSHRSDSYCDCVHELMRNSRRMGC